MRYLTLPDSDVRLYPGSVVIFRTDLDTRWILHMSWYTYEGDRAFGWYFRSIPVGDILPVDKADLTNLIVIDNAEPCKPIVPPTPPPPPVPPVPPDDPVVLFKRSMRDMLYAAFITLQTEEDLLNLDTSIIPDGKLIRVNDVRGEVKYFVWNAPASRWDDINIDPDLSDYVTLEEFNALVSQVDTIASNITWTEFPPPQQGE